MAAQLLEFPLIGFMLGGPVGAIVGAAVAVASAYGISQIPAVQDLTNTIREQAAAARQQSAVSGMVTAQQNYALLSQGLIQQNQSLALANNDIIAAQAGIQAQVDASMREQRAAVAGAVDNVVTTAGTEEEVKARMSALGALLALGTEGTRTVTDSAVKTWEATKTAEAEAAIAAEFAALDLTEAVAAGAGTAVPLAGEIPLSVPLTAAGLAALVPTLAASFAKSSHTQQISCMGTTGGAMLTNIMQAALPTALAAGFMISPQIQSAMTGLAAKALDVLYHPLEEMAPITPEKGPAVGTNLLMQAVLLGSGAHLLSVTAEAAAPLKNMGLGYLSAFMADMAGFSRIAAAFQGMMIQWGLAQPMRYWALQKFQPMIPSEGNLIRLAGEYAITRGEFNKYMGYHGYTPEWRDKLYELADRPLTPMMFRHLGEAGLLDPGLIDRELKNAGYNAWTIPYLKTWLEQVAAGENKGLYGSVVLKTYRGGRLSDDDLAAHLDNLGYSARQQRRAVYASKLDLANELAEDCKSVFLTQFKSGLIESGDLNTRLTALGYIPAKRAVEEALAELKRKPKPEPKPDPRVEAELRAIQAKYIQAYIALYHMGKLTAGELEQAIISAGVSPDLAHITASLEYLKEEAEAQKVGAREEAQAAAEAQRKYEQLAKATAAEKARAAAAEAKLTREIIITLYRKGRATVEELGAVLLAAGDPPEQVALTIGLETAKLLPPVTPGTA